MSYVKIGNEISLNEIKSEFVVIDVICMNDRIGLFFFFYFEVRFCKGFFYFFEFLLVVFYFIYELVLLLGCFNVILRFNREFKDLCDI